MADDKPTYDDRQAQPGAVISTQTATGAAVRFKADDHGVVRVTNDDELEAADYLQLPVATRATQAKAVAAAKDDQAQADQAKADSTEA